MDLAPFAEKSLRFILRKPIEDASINILEGAVRSAKTFTMIPKIVELNKYDVPGKKVFLGKSKQKIYENVLIDLSRFYGARRFSWNSNNGEVYLNGVRWLAIGVKDASAEEYIRGDTFGVVVGDEATLYPENVFNMVMTRLSHENSRAYFTTNPDTPFHYLYTKWLQNQALRDSGFLWSESFTMDDNLSLSAAYRKRMGLQYTGTFFERFILGRWVVAEGAVFGGSWSEANLYDDVSRPIGLRGQGGYVEKFYVVDYGTSNATCMHEIYDDGTTWWVEREWYWDSRVRSIDGLGGYQLSDAAQAERLIEFAGSPGILVVLDPSAASFKAELRSRGVMVKDAVNDVLDGIRKLATAFARVKVRVHKTNCPVTCKQIASYRWDEKAAAHGEEKPIKSEDHAVDPLRYGVATKMPQWRLAA